MRNRDNQCFLNHKIHRNYYRKYIKNSIPQVYKKKYKLNFNIFTNRKLGSILESTDNCLKPVIASVPHKLQGKYKNILKTKRWWNKTSKIIEFRGLKHQKSSIILSNKPSIDYKHILNNCLKQIKQYNNEFIKIPLNEITHIEKYSINKYSINKYNINEYYINNYLDNILSNKYLYSLTNNNKYIYINKSLFNSYIRLDDVLKYLIRNKYKF